VAGKGEIIKHFSEFVEKLKDFPGQVVFFAYLVGRGRGIEFRVFVRT
jgi:hypothetical protein